VQRPLMKESEDVLGFWFADLSAAHHGQMIRQFE
jgi:hypothetical protein